MAPVLLLEFAIPASANELEVMFYPQVLRRILGTVSYTFNFCTSGFMFKNQSQLYLGVTG